MPSESFHLEDGYNEEIQSLQPNSAEEIPCVPTRRQRNLFHLSTLQFTLKRHACLISICILFLFMIGIYISTYENRESLQPGILGDDLNEQIPRSQGLSDLQTVLEERTETVVGLGNSIVANVTPVALNQIQSFRDGSGLIINIHITHHAGTTICHAIGNAPGQKGAPSFACNGVKETENATLHKYIMERKRPWSSEDTSVNVEFFSTYFHMLGWEFRSPPSPPLSETDWEHPNLVSIIVMRDPLSRLLAGDHDTKEEYSNIIKGNASLDEWKAYAESKNTNNFALRILSGRDCCQGEATDPKHLVRAKKLLQRFTFVLDIACLNDGIAAVADILGFEPLHRRELTEKFVVDSRKLTLHHLHPSPSERIPFPEIYDLLRRRNALDIELYEWSKKISLVQCPP